MKKYAFSYPILLKLAGFEKEALSNATTYGLGGAAAGALLGALVDRKKRLRGALLGALAGGAGGYGLGYQRDYVSDRKQKDEANRQTMRRDARRAAHRKAFDERLDAADRELARYGLEPEFRPEYYSYGQEDYNDRRASDYVEEANRRIAGHGVDRGAVTVNDIVNLYWSNGDKQYDKWTKILGLAGVENALMRAANVKPTIEGDRIPFHAGKSKDDIAWGDWLTVHGDEPAVRYLNTDR